MKRLILLVLLSTSISGAAQVSKSEAKKWQSDLILLYDQLQERHVDLYHTVSKSTLDDAINKLHEEIPQLTTSQILVRIAQVVALVRDGHTSFFPGEQRRKRFGIFNARFWFFSDGIYIMSIAPEHSAHLGKKVKSIEGTPIDEAFDLIASTIGVDNNMEYTYSVPLTMERPELLHTLGITQSPDLATFEFEDGSSVSLKKYTLKEQKNLKWRSANGLYKDGISPSQRLEYLFASKLTIDSLKHRRYYWYTPIDGSKAIFLQYNRCWNQKNRPSFDSYIKTVFKEFDRLSADRLIVDLRQNSGGEPKIFQPLVDELKKRKSLMAEGRVFVLVGRRTFSAALTNALQLRKIGAIVVGEPSRGKPNNPSEGRDIVLKKTRIWATVSTEFVERDFDLGDAQFIPVDIPVAHTIAAFKEGKDMDIEAALNAPLKNR